MGGIDKFQSDLAEYNNAFEQLWDEHLEKIIKDACRVVFSEGFALELGENKISQESEEPVNSSASPVQHTKAEIPLVVKEKLACLMVDWVKYDNNKRYQMVSECVAELSAIC